ncbi:MAG: hypothetical protein JAY74_15105, partial [Candidatus Thiodiazotropha taylori]|nr:hypothetical protein [Candidatus Thiodiazotropha taylori]
YRMYAFPSPSSHLVSHVENRGVNYFGVGSSFVKGVVRLIEVLKAIDNIDMAIEIQERALSYFSHVSIKSAMQ